MSWIQRDDLLSWGRSLRGPQWFQALANRDAPVPQAPHGASLLPRGNGRSYGDVGLNLGQAVLGMSALDRFILFDPANGLLCCEAGVLLADILELILPQGWFLPVVPGTKFVTVGGAIANDVHGKNHHARGNFGRHVESIELLRTNGEHLLCSPSENAGMYTATVGGLGLTGVILSASLRLIRIASPWLNVETLRFRSLSEFEALTEPSEASHEHVVAWVDATGAHAGRGILLRANVLEKPLPGRSAHRRAWSVPLTPPTPLVFPVGVRAFNAVYFHRTPAQGSQSQVHVLPFMFPLDSIRHWNRIYGPRGFYQYQCVVPPRDASHVMQALLRKIAASGQASFLSVLKRFGNQPSTGLLSFPQPGWTLALDFPNKGASTLALFAALDELVLEAGGRLYPAKDGRMSSTLFQRGYPEWEAFLPWMDPGLSSSFWRRVSAPCPQKS